MTHLMQNPRNVAPTEHRSQGGRLVAPGGESLPLSAVDLRTEAEGGVARTELRQVFANPHDEPLNLTYTFPLPADGAVAGFEVRVGDRTIQGEIEARKKARKRYERALIDGRTAALLDEERANLFTQNLGNVPPRTELIVTMRIDQPLAWLDDGRWEWRFPTVSAPRYLGSEGRVPDAEQVTVDVADGPTRTRASLELTIRDGIADGTLESPSHSISADGGHVGFEGEGVSLDRDIVIRWPVATPEPGVSLHRARPGKDAVHATSAYGLLTLVPPSIPTQAISRDVIVLLDTSGSMNGAPLAQAKKLVGRLIDSLTQNDRLELVAFATNARSWKKHPVEVSDSTRAEAGRWVEALRAGGATEMVTAIREALHPLREDAVRQVLLVTDGLIGFEGEALESVRKNLPAGSRLHAVGVGSATNQAFLHAAARAGRGVEIVVGVDEPVDAPGDRIVAATHGPAVVDVSIEGSAVEACFPEKPADLMSASPVLQGLRLRPEGGELTVSGRTSRGPWQSTLEVHSTDCGEGNPAVTALVGRESVGDLELDLACGARRPDADSAIEKIGLEFGIATRLTSWIAISQEPTVDVRQPVRVERLPQELPYGMSAEGLGLRVPLSVCDHFFDEAAFRQEASLDLASPTSRQAPVRLLGRLRDGVSEILQRWRRGRQDPAERIARVSEKSRKALERLTHALHDLDAAGDRSSATEEQVEHEIFRLVESSRTVKESAEALRRLSDEMRSLSDELQSDVAEINLASLAAKVTAEEEAHAFKLAGRIHESPDPGSSVITFRADREFVWSPPNDVTLIRGDARSRIRVEARGTTAACSVSKGSLLRIQIEAPLDTLGDAQGVEVISGEEEIQVEFVEHF